MVYGESGFRPVFERALRSAICASDAPDEVYCGVIRSVFRRVGVALTGNADSIVDQISGSGWSSLEDGVAALLRYLPSSR